MQEPIEDTTGLACADAEQAAYFCASLDAERQQSERLANRVVATETTPMKRLSLPPLRTGTRRGTPLNRCVDDIREVVQQALGCRSARALRPRGPQGTLDR